MTRDADFGVTHGDNSFLNDWLQIEFKERINQRRKIILTDKLSRAFKILEIPVTDEMVEEENTIITTRKIEEIQKNEATKLRAEQFREKIRLFFDESNDQSGEKQK